MEFKRHSKSIDPARHRCGACKSTLVQTKPAPRSAMPSEYQLFMKENFKNVKEANPGSPQKEIMRLIGKQYQEYKASKNIPEQNGNYVEPSAIQIRDAKDDDELDNVAQKLDILHLNPI